MQLILQELFALIFVIPDTSTQMPLVLAIGTGGFVALIYNSFIHDQYTFPIRTAASTYKKIYFSFNSFQLLINFL